MTFGAVIFNTPERPEPPDETEFERRIASFYEGDCVRQKGLSLGSQ